MRVLILGAFQDELSNFLKTLSNITEKTIAKRRCLHVKKDGIELTFSFSGIGTTAAASTTTALCERFEPDFIILAGVAGGLEKDQKIGDLILANKIVDADLYSLQKKLAESPFASCLKDPHTLNPITNEYKVQSSMLDIGASVDLPRLKIGTIVTSNIFPAPKEIFDEIKKIGCSAIEMESVGVFKAAEYYGTPALTVRAVSNLLNVSGEDLGTQADAVSICSNRLSLFLGQFLLKIKTLKPQVSFNQQRKIAELVAKYDLRQHPEGGWYRQTYKSKELVTSNNTKTRSAGTSIIYLLSEGDFSAWHTVQSDETWNFHAGDPLLLRIIDPENGKLEEIILSLTSRLQLTIKAGHIFSAESTGRFSLTGCMVTPGFDYKDFKLVSRHEFITKYPIYDNLAYLARDKPVVSVDLIDDIS